MPYIRRSLLSYDDRYASSWGIQLSSGVGCITPIESLAEDNPLQSCAFHSNAHCMQDIDDVLKSYGCALPFQQDSIQR